VFAGRRVQGHSGMSASLSSGRRGRWRARAYTPPAQGGKARIRSWHPRPIRARRCPRPLLFSPTAPFDPCLSPFLHRRTPRVASRRRPRRRARHRSKCGSPCAPAFRQDIRVPILVDRSKLRVMSCSRSPAPISVSSGVGKSPHL
jgi:hypothetical protein